MWFGFLGQFCWGFCCCCWVCFFLQTFDMELFLISPEQPPLCLPLEDWTKHVQAPLFLRWHSFDKAKVSVTKQTSDWFVKYKWYVKQIKERTKLNSNLPFMHFRHFKIKFSFSMSWPSWTLVITVPLKAMKGEPQKICSYSSVQISNEFDISSKQFSIPRESLVG